MRIIKGHKETHEVELALFSHLKMWDSYRQAWAEQGLSEEACPRLWGLLVREERERKDGTREQIEWGLVSVRPLPNRKEALQHWRQRWGLENCGFRELNQVSPFPAPPFKMSGLRQDAQLCQVSGQMLFLVLVQIFAPPTTPW